MRKKFKLFFFNKKEAKKRFDVIRDKRREKGKNKIKQNKKFSEY